MKQSYDIYLDLNIQSTYIAEKVKPLKNRHMDGRLQRFLIFSSLAAVIMCLIIFL